MQLITIDAVWKEPICRQFEVRWRVEIKDDAVRSVQEIALVQSHHIAFSSILRRSVCFDPIGVKMCVVGDEQQRRNVVK